MQGPPTAEPLAVAGVTLAFDEGIPVLDGVDLIVRAGEVLALLGPSGCGKTTLLRVIAGLEVPAEGTVVVGGRTLTSPSRLEPPERRGVGMVFQDWALFPHLSVAANVGFGLPRGQRRASARIDDTLELVGLAGFGDRMPDTLSGGQQQRVALGRALAQRPAVLLLDEPFSNLDASLRSRVRADVRTLLAEVGVTTILVTHDRDEAFVLGDRVAVMRSGRVLQVGRPSELYTDPDDEWVAGFVGEVTVLVGLASGEFADTVAGPVALRRPTEGPVRVIVRPEQFVLDPPQRETSVAVGRVTLVEYHGPRTAYTVELDGADGAAVTAEVLRVVTTGLPAFGVDESVAVRVPPVPLVAFPA